MRKTIIPPGPKTTTHSLTPQQVSDELRELVHAAGSFTTDNYGQLVCYSGIFRWSDDTYHYHEEPKPKKRTRRKKP